MTSRPLPKDSDHIMESQLTAAYNEGYDAYPNKSEKHNPYKNSHPILRDSWVQGWHDHLDEPSDL